jgi:hypothetical protein
MSPCEPYESVLDLWGSVDPSVQPLPNQDTVVILSVYDIGMVCSHSLC